MWVMFMPVWPPLALTPPQDTHHVTHLPDCLQIDHLSNLGVEVAHRMGYDDFNESMCSREIVQDTLVALRVKPEQLQNAYPNDAYQGLTNLGFTKHSIQDFDPQVGGCVGGECERHRPLGSARVS